MIAIRATAFILAVTLTVIASLNISPTAAAQTDCVQALTSSTVNDSWTSVCVSRNRTEFGTHYAKSFTFTLTRQAEVTITLESATDPYLFLLSGTGGIIAENDDIDLPASNFNSRIVRTLNSGDYTIEATTYYGANIIGKETAVSPSPQPA